MSLGGRTELCVLSAPSLSPRALGARQDWSSLGIEKPQHGTRHLSVALRVDAEIGVEQLGTKQTVRLGASLLESILPNATTPDGLSM